MQSGTMEFEELSI